MKDRTFGDPASLDILAPSTTHNSVGPHVYSALFQFKPGVLKPTENEIAGDVVESWEWAPDGLSATLKLRPGVKFHDKPPINGRALDTDDVLFSWDRFSRLSSGRIGVANSADPDGPVLSLTAPDAKTLVLKLKEPLTYALALFAENLGGRPLMIAKETGTSFDIRGDAIGTGPFVLTKYTPSVGFNFKRNPDYYDQDFAFVEQIELPIVAEYAAALAQLKAGNIYSMGSGGNTPKVKAEDILPTKREESRLSIYPGDLAGGGPRMGFGYLPGSPFLDERIRQAASMSIDRDLYIDTFQNVSKFTSEGLPMETRWNTSLSGSLEGWWLDPQGKEFGANAKYYKHDLAEAKKLLSAAGHPNGMQNVTSTYITSGELGDLPKQSSVIEGMLLEGGIATKFNPVDYNTQYIPKYRDNQGRFDGLVFKLPGGGAGKNDPVGALSSEFWSKGGVTFYGFDSAKKGDQSGDPEVEALIVKARVERDINRRKALVYDIQRLLAKGSYGILPPGVATTFVMAWPSLGNFRVYQGGRLNYRLWVDQTKAPIAKA
ncbi:MAG TPA: ABC transporter substrate-binding protein [Dehalococcoidia bacterium]|nr:ABC transporter substrate-binding protein [Dehalococcoidia bacterium]